MAKSYCIVVHYLHICDPAYTIHCIYWFAPYSSKQCPEPGGNVRHFQISISIPTLFFVSKTQFPLISHSLKLLYENGIYVAVMGVGL